MPGPLSRPDGNSQYSRHYMDHRYCQQGISCKGPGCRFWTGKTRAKAMRLGDPARPAPKAHFLR